ncbi:DNA polymerase zeta catalytic subunit [Musca autumnalis]|uniref:DNA polymerase zeta catalytic subunit n=1 Tax=Musca autumnalis TaxID=221902 RepID=UPI003CF10176
MSTTSDGIFSLRLVIADFYMEKPVPGLDPVYSEFRGKEIKKVPIIRVFGSNAQGQKTCMHIHGVFPYFYVPYDQKDFESVNKAIYQIAMNLDKAINISLSQGSSNVQHVFKVQLVKGIPFYGYHRSEHQYLKIHMFNPRFVRRAANLLQNGAIMNKNFHPHEAHVPYILQFMIDYNLYGMSMIHVPLEIVKFRRTDAAGSVPVKNVTEAQLLDCDIAKKLSCCSIECDIGSNFILNRFQLVTKSKNSTHSNPGIESIWNDEKLRREKLSESLKDDEEKLKGIPALEVPPTQERPIAYPTESEVFYRTALVSKLIALENSIMETTQSLSDQTINCTQQSNMSNITLNTSLNVTRQQKRTFNLTKMLQNAVYPEECSQESENLINASFVENHLSSNNVFQQSLSNKELLDLTKADGEKLSEDESVFLEDTIVDEDLVLSLTQSQPHVPHNATLREEDMELLDILQQLENDNNCEKIDLDSSLAPLSQNQKDFALSPELLDKETAAAALENSHCNDDDLNKTDDTEDNLHDFSVALDDLDDLILKLTQTVTENMQQQKTTLPQNDGSDDVPKTPSKVTSKTISNTRTPPRTPTTPQRRHTLGSSPSRSPRTPKSGHKFKPLPLIITNRSTGKQIITNPDAETTSKSSVEERSKNLISLRKRLALSELRRKSISLESTEQVNVMESPAVLDNASTNRRRSKRNVNLDKTHVTCNLTPRRTNEKLLRVYSVEGNENAEQIHENCENNVGNVENTITTHTENESRTQHQMSNFGCDTFQLEDNIPSSTHNNIQQENEITVSDEKVEEPSFQFRKTPNLKLLKNRNSRFETKEDCELVACDQKDDKEKGDDDDEVIVSEDEDPSFQFRKTPNLKRLRRSLLSTSRAAKRRKLACPNNEICETSDEVGLINTSLSKGENRRQNVKISKGQEVDSSKIENNSPKENKGQSSRNQPLIDSNSMEKQQLHQKECLINMGHTEKSNKNSEDKIVQNCHVVPVDKGINKLVWKNCRVRLKRVSHQPTTSFRGEKEEGDFNKEVIKEKIENYGVKTKHMEISKKVDNAPELIEKFNTKSLFKNCRVRLKRVEHQENMLSSKENNNQNGHLAKDGVESHKKENQAEGLQAGPHKVEDNATSSDMEHLSRKGVTQELPKCSKESSNNQYSIVETTEEENQGEECHSTTDNEKHNDTSSTMEHLRFETSEDSEETFKTNGVESRETSFLDIIECHEEWEDERSLIVDDNNQSIGENMGNLKENNIELDTKDLEDEIKGNNSSLKETRESNSNEQFTLRALTEEETQAKSFGNSNKICENSSNSSKQISQDSGKSSDSFTAPLGFTGNANVLNVLLKLSALGESLGKPIATEESDKTPPAIPKHSKSPSIEFCSQSSEDEIAETPSPPPVHKHNKDKKMSKYYEHSMNSPSLFTQNSSPSSLTQNKQPGSSYEDNIVITSSYESMNNNDSLSLDSKIALTPLDLPPTRDEVLKGCEKLKLHKYEFQQPFYSNPDDVTKHKEIGFTILQINSNKLNDVEEFQSILGNDIKGLNSWRRRQLALLGGPEMLNKYRNAQRVREYFATQKQVAIEPLMSAPSRHDAKLWLKARELLKQKGNLKDEEKPRNLTEEDSPIKVKRQKVTMMLNAGGDGDGSGDNDSDNSLDCSSMSLTLTPLTPSTPATKETSQLKEKINKSFTPVTTKLEKIPLERLNPLTRRRHNRRVLRRVSLNKAMQEALEKHNSISSQENSKKMEEVIPKSADESILPHSSQTSESSISSQTALAEMERSSFMRQLEGHDVTTVGGAHSGHCDDTTFNSSYGFKVALENLQQAKADIEFNYLTIVTLELFVATRDDLFPNPQIDEIRCIFYGIENSIPSDHENDSDKKLPRKSCGYIMVHDPRDKTPKEGHIHGLDKDIHATIVNTEVEALEALLGLVQRWDPDIYAGYEIEMSSWGYIIDRAKYLCLNIAPLLSRVPTQKTREFVDEDRDSFTDLDVEMKLCGRILLDVWRLMRSEIALTSYTFENVMYHIMHKRCPCHSYRTLTEWYFSPGSRWIVLEYYLERVRGTLALLDQLDLIGRTSEMAKLIGIQFYEVLSRGSQFRVESMMLRIAKPRNLVPASPSVQQRAHMRAPEYLPLILEPQSRFYADPLIVLDFQSLYPSMIIGYNYCFSTCLGRVEHLGISTPFEFGASQLRVSPTMLRKLVDRDLITISPCGVVFVKSSVREGILPRMLTEILDTRQMVKQSMKLHKSNSALQRILHSRQLGLKLMANVTYGYTAANFSGRMPCVEVGDSVVAKGRETLERAIKTVEANEKWNVKVVYGDTDSLFVLVPGRNREEAFRIGEEIADVVTKQNPHPVKLKLEKVYQPCILQTKKRYVGYMYETPDQEEPVYEAKGIETVRRDGCPMVAKMLEKVLRILFETADVSQVKQYVCRQFTKLLSGRANLQDLIFAKEFRGMNGYKANACVPALELTRKWLQTDPRRIPRRGERVPFIITNGPPGVPLIRLIRHPHEVLADEGLKINAIYYITKAIIPPLNRCLLLIGADVNEWFTNLPRKILMTPALSTANEVISCGNSKSKKSTISQFFSSTNCMVDCGRQTKQGICDACCGNPTRSMVILQTKMSKIERAYLTTQHICQACCGRIGDLKCSSLDCPVLYVLEVKRRDLQQIVHFRNLIEEKF